LKRAKTFLVILLAGMLLAGCAAEREFREGKALLGEGKVEEGLAKLEKASRDDPDSHEYRAHFFRSRDIALGQLLAQADGLRGKGQGDEAEAIYQRILGIDANHVRAKAGVAAVAMDRRHKAATAEAEALFKKGDLEAAQARLRPVLQENSSYREAVSLNRRIDERIARDTIAMPVLKASMKKPITLEFRDANLKSVFEVISRSAGVNFIFDKDVRPDLKATIFVKNTSIEDAIKLLLVTNQLEKKALNDSTVLVYPNNPAKHRDYQDLMVKSFYLANTDSKQALNLVKVMLKTKDVFIDEKLNLLVMRDTPEAVRLAEKLLANLDLAEPEVMLDVEVLEVSSKRLMELGVNWPNRFSVLSAPQTSTTSSTVGGALVVNTNTTSGPLTLESLKSVNASQIGVPNPVLNLRKEDGDTNVLANPRIRVKNREKAKIHIGDRLPVITTTSTANVGVAESVSYLDVGLKLDVEPNVYLEDDVAIKVGLEVSNVVNTIKSASGTTAYQIGTRNATTVLRLKDGETQVLAGLINDEDRKSASKVPGLGDLPLLGRLFSSHLGETNKNEIVLLITPHVVRNIMRPDATTSEFMSGTESNVGAPPITLKPAEIPAAVAPRTASAPVPPAQTRPEVAKADVQGSLDVSWQGPTQARIGEPFTLTLNLASDQPVSTLPLLIGYDPSALQAVTVSEGEFLKQNNVQTQFSQRVDQAAGRIFVGMGRAGGDGAKGSGQLLSITFKPLQETPQAQVQLLALSAGGEAAKQAPVILPVVYTLTVSP